MLADLSKCFCLFWSISPLKVGVGSGDSSAHTGLTLSVWEKSKDPVALPLKEGGMEGLVATACGDLIKCPASGGPGISAALALEGLESRSNWCSLNVEQDLSLTGSVGVRQVPKCRGCAASGQISGNSGEARWPQNTKLLGRGGDLISSRFEDRLCMWVMHKRVY